MRGESRSRSKSPSRGENGFKGDRPPSEPPTNKVYVTFLPEDVPLRPHRLKKAHSGKFSKSAVRWPGLASRRRKMGSPSPTSAMRLSARLRMPLRNLIAGESETRALRFSSAGTTVWTIEVTARKAGETAGTGLTDLEVARIGVGQGETFQGTRTLGGALKAKEGSMAEEEEAAEAEEGSETILAEVSVKIEEENGVPWSATNAKA